MRWKDGGDLGNFLERKFLILMQNFTASKAARDFLACKEGGRRRSWSYVEVD